MKPYLDNINKILENKIRLGILSILAVNESVSFGELKELLSLSDGNLASHIKTLEQENYISSHKKFIGRKPNTSFSITQNGRSAFVSHLNAMEEFINAVKQN